MSDKGSLTTLLESIVVTDAYYGDITSSKIVGTLPNLNTIGTKTLTVTCTDPSGNSEVLTITVNVTDDVPPVINGAIKIVKGQTATLTLADILGQLSSMDNVDGERPIVLSIDNYTGNESIIVVYNNTYTSTDLSGNTSIRVVQILVLDNIPPVWVVNGYFVPLSLNQIVTQEQLITYLEESGMIVEGLSYTISFVTDEYTGNENVVGEYDVTMLISYGDGSQDTVTLTLAVPQSSDIIPDDLTDNVSIIKYILSAATSIAFAAMAFVVIKSIKKK